VTPPAIADNDLFTGREVKRLLAEIQRDSSPYVKIQMAHEITGTARSTLKAQAPRYHRMQVMGEAPPIRMRRTSDAKGAHWLFHEGDCWALRREAPPATDNLSPIAQRYASKAAREWTTP
jgi:hypothetical protein